MVAARFKIVMKLIVKVLAGVLIMAQGAVAAGQVFMDIDEGSEYFVATEYLARAGVVDGYGDGAFRPERAINRAEFLKILIEAKVGEIYGVRDAPFSDVRYGDWYAKYVGYAYEAGWISGYPDGSFRPGQKMTRAEAVTLLSKTASLQKTSLNGGDSQKVFLDVNSGDWFGPSVEGALNRGLIDDSHAYFRPHSEITRGEMANLVYRSFFSVDSGQVALVSYEEEIKPDRNVLIDMPFTAQAPLGEWSDPRQNDGCEEASVLMAVKWARGERINLEEAKEEIVAIAEYEKAHFPTFIDTSVEDTMNWIVKGYFNFYKVELVENVTAEDIKQELFKGNLVIVAANGRVLKNRYYTPPGPLQHMLVIKGYDAAKQEFITNDPGTRHGENYRYGVQVMEEALYDYRSGEDVYLPAVQEKRMLVIRR